MVDEGIEKKEKTGTQDLTPMETRTGQSSPQHNAARHSERIQEGKEAGAGVLLMQELSNGTESTGVGNGSGSKKRPQRKAKERGKRQQKGDTTGA